MYYFFFPENKVKVSLFTIKKIGFSTSLVIKLMQISQEMKIYQSFRKALFFKILRKIFCAPKIQSMKS